MRRKEKKKKKRGFSSISHYWVWLENKIFPESINASIRKKKRKTEMPCSWLLNRLLQDVGVPRPPCSLHTSIGLAAAWWCPPQVLFLQVPLSPSIAHAARCSEPTRCQKTYSEQHITSTKTRSFSYWKNKKKWMFLCSTEIPRAPEAPWLKPPLG